MIHRQIFTVVLSLTLNPILFVDASDVRDAYLEIQKIKDPDTRIVSELSLSVLGLPLEAPTNRIRSFQKLRALAADSPSDEYHFTIVLSHGHSAKELAPLIDAGNFQSITGLQAKFVEGKLVTTLGLAGFDVYEGPTRKVLEFLLYEHRETQRALTMAMKAAGVDPTRTRSEDLIAKMGDIETIPFYVISGVMKASDAEALIRNKSSAVMNVKISRHNSVNFSIPDFVSPAKKPLPFFDINKPAPMSIMSASDMLMMKEEEPVSSSPGNVE